eukprot:CFRG2123T1
MSEGNIAGETLNETFNNAVEVVTSSMPVTLSSSITSHLVSLLSSISPTPVSIIASSTTQSPTPVVSMASHSLIASAVPNITTLLPSPVPSPVASLAPHSSVVTPKQIDSSVLVHGWAPFTVGWTLAVVVTVGYILYFKSNTHSNWKATLICILTSMTTLALSALLPVDVFLVSSSKTDVGTLASWADADSIAWVEGMMSDVYMSLYVLLLVLMFFVIPFAFFYFDEPGQDTAPAASRAFFAMRNTAGLVVLVVALLLTAVVLKPDTHPKDTPDDRLHYILDILHANAGDRGVYLCVGVLTMIGLLIWCTYTAWGLIFLPLALLMERPVSETGIDGWGSSALDSLDRTRLLDVYSSDEDDDESMDVDVNVNQTSSTLAQSETKRTLLSNVLRPGRILLGLLSLALSLLIVSAVVLNSLDRTLHSEGLSYGFTLASPQFTNSIDWLFMHLHKVFPLDFVFLGLLGLYMIMCTLAALRAIGVRFLGVKLYDVQRGNTSIHGLLLISLSLALIIMSMHVTMLTLAPQYVMFGSQTYINNGTVTPCDTSPRDDGVCTMTRAAVFSHRLSYNYPIFGVIVFAMNWFFILVFTMATPVVIIVQRRPRMSGENVAGGGGVIGMLGGNADAGRSLGAPSFESRPLTEGLGLDDDSDDSDFDDFNEMESL